MRNTLRREHVLMISGVLCAGVTAQSALAGDPTLLASWPTGVIAGSPEFYDSRWPAICFLTNQNEILAPLFEDLALPPSFPVDLNDTITPSDDADFNDFARLVTDGVDESLIVGPWDHSGFLGGGGGPESFDLAFEVQRFGPDLVGYAISHIVQVVTVNIESPGSDPFGDGNWTDWSVTGRYEFWGTPVPEPSTVACLFLGVAILACRRLHPKPLG